MASSQNPLDECECGDYRSQHKDGTGKCCMPDDNTHGHRPCFSFRLAFPQSGPLSREGIRAALRNHEEGQ